jgi:hypothetical protein
MWLIFHHVPGNFEPSLRASLVDTPIVFLTGARQTGKSTLARALISGTDGRYITLDDATSLSAARACGGLIGGRSAFQESIVVSMRSYPEPEQAVLNPDGECPVVQADSY